MFIVILKYLKNLNMNTVARVFSLKMHKNFIKYYLIDLNSIIVIYYLVDCFDNLI